MKTNKFNQVKTQEDAVLWHLQNKYTITSWEAIKEYGITRLAAHICNLRKKGEFIISEPKEITTKFGRKTIISKYIWQKPYVLNKYFEY